MRFGGDYVLRMRAWALALVICLLTALSGRAAASTVSFSDMNGHWAADLVSSAAAAGYVDGYPDGTFRPDAQVTRAEIVKLVVAAGRLGLVHGDYVRFEDTPPYHWVVLQRYLDTAVSNGIVPFETRFRPDDPATRLEVLQFALRLLNAPYVDPPVPAEPPTFSDVSSDEEWRWIHAGVELGLVNGYPNGTFRPDGPVTRAEAVAIVARTVAWMTKGTDPNLRLVVNGEPIPDAELAMRDGLIFAPAAAIYQDPRMADWRKDVGPETHAFAANEQFALCSPVVTFKVGERKVTASEGAEIDELPALPYLRFQQLMIPAAPVEGTGTLPYAEAVYDPDAGMVTVTFTEDWPGHNLPADPSQVRLTTTVSLELDPLRRPSGWVQWPALTDERGNCVQVRQRTPVTFSVNPVDPLRLRGDDGRLVTTYTSGPSNGWRLPEVVLTSDSPAEGTYIVRSTSGDYGPGEQRVTVVDKGSRRLVLGASGPLKVGQEAAVQITAVDRYGRPSDYDMAAYPGRPIPDPLQVIGPDGAAVEVQPHLHEGGTIDFILEHGKGSFTFTPEAPGTYRVLVPWSAKYGQVDGYLEGTFEVSP